MNLARWSLFSSLVCGGVAAASLLCAPRATADEGPALTLPHSISASALLTPSPESDALLDALVAGRSGRLLFNLDGIEPDAARASFVESDEVNCGDAKAVATPDAGVAGQGWGPTEGDALFLAILDGLSKLKAYSGVTCVECPDPNQCQMYISLLLDSYEIETYQSGGMWHAVVRYKGPYLAGCSPCEF